MSPLFFFQAPMEEHVATETITRLIDDLDGGKADETIKVGLDGQLVEVDLSAKNAKVLRATLQPYISRGTKVPVALATVAKRSGRNVVRSVAENTAIRAWAQAQGYDVAKRGRITQSIVDDYHNKH